jgi:lysophospholipid acyltransferase (LPLAT)-like uncharacterized protein
VKKLIRTPWVQSALAWLVSVMLGFTLATIRWRIEGREDAEVIIASPDGAIACFWHGRIALAPICGRVLRKKPRRVVISASPDGEFIAKVVKRLKFPAIRGSGFRAGAVQDQRSYDAARDASRFIHSGGVLAITPDGPVGPAEQAPVGPVMLSKIAKAPVFVVGLAARPALTLNSWDKTQIPLPFGRGCVVIDRVLTVPRDAKADAIEAARAEIERRLRGAQARAEAALASG